jgi:hypothetical protein
MRINKGSARVSMHNMGVPFEQQHSCVSNPFVRRRISQVRTRVISFAQTFSRLMGVCVPDMALRLVDVLFENVCSRREMAPRVPVFSPLS